MNGVMENHRVAVLMTCFNRVAKTLDCLMKFQAAEVPKDVHFEIFLVDDGSQDGTGDQVKRTFPDVHVLQGDGNLFWGGGMNVAWQEASKYSFDAYLWLNDDTLLYPDALECLYAAACHMQHRGIICSTLVSKSSDMVTYGGWNEKGGLMSPKGHVQECAIINGNCVWIPRRVFDAIGMLDPIFRHAIGDFDYGLRARMAGFGCYIAPNVLGSCEANPSLPRWCLPEVPFVKRLKILYSPLAYAHPTQFFVYERRHFGLAKAARHWCSIHLRVVFPKLWNTQA